MKVITNNVPRDIVEAWELTEKERKEFDYLDWEKIMDGSDSASFFRYRGQIYDLGEFMRVPDGDFFMDGAFKDRKWDGYESDSYFSGIVVRYVENFERVIVGTYLA